MFILVCSAGAHAADWYSCESELSRVQRHARNAKDVASDLDSLNSELEMLRNEYEDCVQFPEIYDLLQDGCSSQVDDYNWKVNEYNSRLSDLQSVMDSLIRRVRNSQSYCG